MGLTLSRCCLCCVYLRQIGKEYTLLPPQADNPKPTGQPYRTLVLVPEGLLWTADYNDHRFWRARLHPQAKTFLAKARDLGFEVVLWSDRQRAEPLAGFIQVLNEEILDTVDEYSAGDELEDQNATAPTNPVIHGLGSDNTAVCADWEGEERLLRDLNRIARPLEHTLAFDMHRRGFSKPADGKEHVIIVPEWKDKREYEERLHSRLFKALPPEQQEEMRQGLKAQEKAGALVLDRIQMILEGSQQAPHTQRSRRTATQGDPSSRKRHADFVLRRVFVASSSRHR